jgi:3-deoxy-7-phosphoheptulonate synthase
MIIVMRGDVGPDSEAVQEVVRMASRYPGVSTQVRTIQGATRSLTEVYLLGLTSAVPREPFEELTTVEKVIRIKAKYRAIGRHEGEAAVIGFTYNGVEFGPDMFHLMPGLCAVDNPENVEATFRVLKDLGIHTTRAGAYKPRTSPYDFQGHGKECLPYVFELAGKYDIRVIAMEVTHESHVREIQEALVATGKPTGVMLQIGTRNAQNFELLKAVGQQAEMPVLYKRGMGITLEESLNACEYVASSGNHRIVFCLRGMRTNLGDPHRNFVDFSHVPVVRRLTRLSVFVDPSHSVGGRFRGADGLLDIHHVAAQGVVAGANGVIVDVHPNPREALCDGPQALLLHEVEHFVKDMELARRTYVERVRLAERLLGTYKEVAASN